MGSDELADSPENLVAFLGGHWLANELAPCGKLVEVLLLAVSHILLHQAARVRDLPLLADVVVLDGGAESIVVGLDESADLGDVEGVWVGALAEVCWQLHLLAGALRAASVNSEVADAAWLTHFERNHYRRDDFVADFGRVLHGANDDVDAVPSACLD
mmetsp:Transcript_25466/g.34018  ORF Transcript_25466/g.34018 Transcript_25466/m.34018 type:complete len:158 (+) Transcript_25466:157-630(+)